MSGHVISPAAAADLHAIWDYGEERWGIDQADLYARSLQRAIATVAGDPRRGRPCDEVRPGYLKFAVGVHMLFYRPYPDGIDIVRVLHQRMDFGRYL